MDNKCGNTYGDVLCVKNVGIKTMKNSGFPSFKIGRRRFVEKDKLINWIRENQAESGEISIIKL